MTSASLIASALESRRLAASQIAAARPPVVSIANKEKELLPADFRTGQLLGLS